MQNVIAILAIGLVGTFTITVLARFGKEWIYASIVVHLILISLVGGKLIPVLGVTTNVGNVFYMNILFATYLLIERFGRKAAYQSIWIGLAFTILFVIKTQLALTISGVEEMRSFDQHLNEVLKIVPRVAFASLFAFVVSQTLNVWLFDMLRQKAAGKRLWLRTMISIGTSQLFDTIIFFSIAFLQVLSPSALVQLIIAAYLTKLAHGALIMPFLYFSQRTKKVSAEKS